jgi:hypothetical protein
MGFPGAEFGFVQKLCTREKNVFRVRWFTVALVVCQYNPLMLAPPSSTHLETPVAATISPTDFPWLRNIATAIFCSSFVFKINFVGRLFFFLGRPRPFTGFPGGLLLVIFSTVSQKVGKRGAIFKDSAQKDLSKETTFTS